MTKPSDGHAYSSQDLFQLRRTLSLSEEEWPDAKLHEHTDALVVLIGRVMLVTREEGSKARLQRLDRKLLAPTGKFLDALQNDELAQEYLQDWLPLDETERQEIFEQVSAFKATVETHIAKIRKSGSKGKTWDSDLKDRFVTYVDWLCEFLNHEVEPKRVVDTGSEDHSQFGKCVYLLAQPLKWGTIQGSEIKFDGVIRKHVDEWRKALLKTAKELEEERYGRDR